MAHTPLPVPSETYCREHARVDERLNQLEDRASRHERSIAHMSDLASALNGRLERMEGKMDGAMGASRITGAVIAALVTSGLAGVGGIVIFLLQRKG